MNIALISVENY